MKTIRSGLLTISMVILVSITVAFGQAKDFSDDSPGGIIRAYADKTVRTLTDTPPNQRKNMESLRNRLFEELEPIINFRLMTQSSLGPESRRISNDQLKSVISVFRPLVVRLYTDRLLEYMVQKNPPWKLDKIEVTGQEFRGEQFAKVKSVAHVHRGNNRRELSMDFKMTTLNSDRWKVYDLVLENVSLIENYRSQFSSVLANNSVDDLITELEKKLQRIRSDDKDAETLSS